jgi:cell division protein FtsN
MAAPAPATPSAGAVATTALAPAAPASAAAAAPAPAAGGAAPDRPFIQLGIFSVEENAQNLARQMSADGLAARVIRSQSQGRTFWRVVVGPAASTAERDRLLERVKAAGFADAYFVRN